MPEQGDVFVYEAIQAFKLCNAESSIEVWQAVVVSNLIVNKIPFVRTFGRCGEVLCSLGERGIVGHKHSTATSGENFVPIETERCKSASSSSVAVDMAAAQ